MTVLVTGGCGFIGLAAAEALRNAGQVVVLADLHVPEDLARILPGVRACVLDVTDRQAVEDLMRFYGIDRILHAAAVTSTPEHHSGLDHLFRVNVLGTVAVSGAARTLGIKRLVVVSSGAVHEGEAGSHRLSEASLPTPTSAYGVSKLAAEIAARTVLAGSEVDLRVARLGPVFGPFERDTSSRARMSAVYQLVHRAAAGAATTFQEARGGDWLYSRDAGEALSRLMLTDALSHELYLLSGEEVPLAAVADVLRQYLPGGEIRQVAEPSSADLVSDFTRAPFSCARAHADFGFAPRPMAAGVADYLDWLRSMSPSAEVVSCAGAAGPE